MTILCCIFLYPTHVAGIAAGNGVNSAGKYKGIAPQANMVILKILNKEGKGSLIDVLTGIQWMIDNREKYNIRAANLSIGTDNTSSNDPMVKAVEKAWDCGIAVTIAAGNNGPSSKSITSPGISRKAITVGTSDDDSEAFTLWGDNLINFSGRGPTYECIIKPDIVAPGSNIVSCLTPTPYDENKKINSASEKSSYIGLSGTSMSTPIVTGAIALLLEKHKNLKPNDIKLMLKKSCTDLGHSRNKQGWGLINVEKLISQEAVYAKI